MEKRTREHRYKLYKNGLRPEKRFLSARVMDLWNELDDETVVHIVETFQRNLGELGYKDTEVAHTQALVF